MSNVAENSARAFVFGGEELGKGDDDADGIDLERGDDDYDEPNVLAEDKPEDVDEPKVGGRGGS